MRMAFSADGQCHYLWNEITRSDFQTPCTYTVDGDLINYVGFADDAGRLTGYSCTHQDWTDWAGDYVPPIQWGRFRVEGDELWLGVNCHWGGVSGGTNSCKRFPFWESAEQATCDPADEACGDCWVVFRQVTRPELCTELCPSFRPDPAVCAL